MTGTVENGKGFESAREKLDSGAALEKFWEIAETQGATKRINSSEIELGEYQDTLKAPKSGKIEVVDNKEIVKVARALGNPYIKNAGIFLNKTVGDTVRQGDELMTLYATSADRLRTGLEASKVDKLFRIRD